MCNLRPFGFAPPAGPAPADGPKCKKPQEVGPFSSWGLGADTPGKGRAIFTPPHQGLSKDNNPLWGDANPFLRRVSLPVQGAAHLLPLAL